ncbi:MAG TPA: class I SAM-dependent methyltransferase [Candidatus Dojkabacteria bacterium]|nr:class I SAM-dependent methyltransferase [Candidatus Dojkabacteria bacterium]
MKKVPANLNKKELENLIKKYPWLKIYSFEIENYIAPDYYNKLLKDYTFSGKDDLWYFRKFLKTNFKDNKKNSTFSTLELGCGSGRSTQIFFEKFKKYDFFDLVDLSPDMVNSTKNKFINKKSLSFFNEDSLNYLINCKKKYDLIFSLWSYSHSVHQHMVEQGKETTILLLESLWKKIINENLKSGGKVFIIHFDTLSDEMRILTKHWAKFFKVFKDLNQQSLSKRYTDLSLIRLTDYYPVEVKISHLKGDPIEYDSLSEALEIFMNFHMETEYSRHKNLDKIIGEMVSDFSKYKKNGKYFISPGCFIYEVTKL